MKWLLILLLLLPAVLFGQTQRKDIIDSIKAAARINLPRVNEVIGNDRGTKVTKIHVSDSGEYVTMVVRVHVGGVVKATALAPLPVVEIKKQDAVANVMSALDIPPLPSVLEADTLPLLPVAYFTITSSDVQSDIIAIPHLPYVTLADTLPLLDVIQFNIENVARKIYTAIVPPLPYVTLAEALSLLAFTQFKIEAIILSKKETVSIPALPAVECWTIDPISPCAAVEFAIEKSLVRKPDTVSVPYFEDKKMEVTGMHLSEEGYSLLEKLEGFCPELYVLGDGGYTIGFGFFIPYSEGRKWDKGVTWEEAERLIRQKVPTYEDQVKRFINVPLTQREFDALTMLAYNLGGFSKASSIVNDINSQAGFDQLQSDWNRFIHSKAPGVTRGLMNRRRDELGVRNASDYQPERKIQVLKIRR